MNLNKIEAFVNIVETGSITNAAEKLYVSQSTLSDRLSALEEELETRLIQRGPGNKKLNLTEKGTEFLDYAARFLELNKEVDDWKENQQRSEIKVSAPQSVNAYLFRQFYKSYLNNDHYHFDISSHWNRTIYNMVYSFEIDVGIVSRPYQSKQIITESLIEEPLVVIYDKRYANYDDINQMKKENQIYMEWGPAYEKWYNARWDATTPPKISLDSPELLTNYLESNQAWAIVPICVYRQLIANNDHIIKMATEEPIKRILYVIYQKGAAESRNHTIEDFIHALYRYALKLEEQGQCKVLMTLLKKIR